MQRFVCAFKRVTGAANGLIGHWPLTGGKPTLYGTVGNKTVYTFGPVSFVPDEVTCIPAGYFVILR